MEMDLAMRNAQAQSREFDRRLAERQWYAIQGQMMGRGQASGIFGASAGALGSQAGLSHSNLNDLRQCYWRPTTSAQPLISGGPMASNFSSFKVGAITKGMTKEVVESLPKPYNDIALQYLEQKNEEYEVASQREALELAFWWDETLEGTGFWIQLADALEGKGEYPEFEVVMVDGPAKGQKKKFNKIEQMIQVQYIQEVETTKSEDENPKEIECEMKCTVYGHKKGLEFGWIGVVDGKDVLKNDWTKPDYVEYVD
jgi:hypothetical protein